MKGKPKRIDRAYILGMSVIPNEEKQNSEKEEE